MLPQGGYYSAKDIHLPVHYRSYHRIKMKIGFLGQPLTGHLNPMAALARKLASRGHEVAFLGIPDIEPVV
jgi:hypothetical protein